MYVHVSACISSDALYLYSWVNARVVTNVDGQTDKHINGCKIGSLYRDMP